jgi:hypothetical protein
LYSNSSRYTVFGLEGWNSRRSNVISLSAAVEFPAEARTEAPSSQDEIKSTFSQRMVSTLRRIFSLSPILAGLFNTITQVQTLGQNAASITVSEAVVKEAYYCDYGDPVGGIVYCPYENAPAYELFLYGWIAVWGLFFMIELFRTLQFSTYDLRYYVALELSKVSTTSSTFFYFVVFFTIITMIASFAFTASSAASGSASEAAVAQYVQSTIVFGVANIVTTLSLVTSNIPHLKDVEISDLPNPIPVHKVAVPEMGNLWGILVKSEDVFKFIQNALAQSVTDGDAKAMEDIGDVNKITGCMKKLGIDYQLN